MADESLRDALSQVSYYHSPESRISDAKIELKGMEQTRAGDSQSPAEADTNHDTRSRPSAVKKKVVRRDPAKRRLQNRLAQKTYSECFTPGQEAGDRLFICGGFEVLRAPVADMIHLRGKAEEAYPGAGAPCRGIRPRGTCRSSSRV